MANNSAVFRWLSSPAWLPAAPPALLRTLLGYSASTNLFVFDSLDDNAGLEQLPEDVRELYYDILAAAKYQTGIYPAKRSTLCTRVIRPQTPSTRKPDGGSDKDGMGQEEEPFFDYLPVSLLCLPAMLSAPRFKHASLMLSFTRSVASKDCARSCLALRRAEAAWERKRARTTVGACLAEATCVCRLRERNVCPGFCPAFFFHALLRTRWPTARWWTLCWRARSRTGDGARHCDPKQRSSSWPSLKPAGLVSSHPLRQPNRLSTPALRSRVATAIGACGQRLGIGGWECSVLRSCPRCPLILTHDHQWSLSILQPIGLTKSTSAVLCRSGMTGNLPNIYQLLAVLGFLGTWIDTTFSHLDRRCLFSPKHDFFPAETSEATSTSSPRHTKPP
ncbi:hypothetical protein MAPG_10609 [Magnaporthiopsis poae ATCC 64411]|uniref:PD-(D/E)XK nuclease-like domain-containing protein n=1 Tax=Magnaporthiopsis poae (strain ATCC 64411 / 73-15) TaxID=644358 RepID=A0A0C4ED17_MAGP6|nr:hypothetical protein MAPG_10609 [Magnaporthiopsis poae ATCC 64411]